MLKLNNKEYQEIQLEELLSQISKVDNHTKFDIMGFVPFIGEVFDLTNAIWYIGEKKYKAATISLLAMLPFVGKYFLLPRILINVNKQLSKEKATHITNGNSLKVIKRKALN